ncbi:MAG: helix-turn-helix domain-containing protein [Candidatus Lokiarchaeota archaeon]|nr:helix-turn-helix domain-containing protein [Candidatus Lokiarchaeota archaeon]
MSDKDNKKAAIALRLALARKHAGLSQAQAAKLMGLHRPSISEIEAGRRNVSGEELAKFAKLYSVSISWIACEDSDIVDKEKDKIELAARELSKLKKEDLDKVLNLLSALRNTEE